MKFKRKKIFHKDIKQTKQIKTKQNERMKHVMIWLIDVELSALLSDLLVEETGSLWENNQPSDNKYCS